VHYTRKQNNTGSPTLEGNEYRTILVVWVIIRLVTICTAYYAPYALKNSAHMQSLYAVAKRICISYAFNFVHMRLNYCICIKTLAYASDNFLFL